MTTLILLIGLYMPPQVVCERPQQIVVASTDCTWKCRTLFGQTKCKLKCR